MEISLVGDDGRKLFGDGRLNVVVIEADKGGAWGRDEGKRSSHGSQAVLDKLEERGEDGGEARRDVDGEDAVGRGADRVPVSGDPIAGLDGDGKASVLGLGG